MVLTIEPKDSLVLVGQELSRRPGGRAAGRAGGRAGGRGGWIQAMRMIKVQSWEGGMRK